MFGNLKIRELSNQLRPRERLQTYGAQALSDAELLAIIVSSGGKSYSAFGVATNLLNRYETLKKIFSLDLKTLQKVSQIGNVKAVTFKAVEEISKRIINEDELKPLVTSPKDIFKIVRKYTFGKTQEHLYLISLDSKNRMLSIDLLTKGTLNETLISPREIYIKAFQNEAVNIILVHNHPSNDPTPSDDDITVTQSISKTGINLGVVLLDHVVVSDTKFVSLKAMNVFNTYDFSERR